jgi:hypothetical protein
MMQGKPGKMDNAFVTFRTKNLALKAIEKLDNSTFKVCFPLSYTLTIMFSCQ